VGVGQAAVLGDQVGQRTGAVGQPGAVGGAVQVEVEEIGDRLGQGQRQMAQVAGELLDLPGVVVAALGGEFGPQVADGLALGEQADVDEVAG
jgi:hypothetical protein